MFQLIRRNNQEAVPETEAICEDSLIKVTDWHLLHQMKTKKVVEQELARMRHQLLAHSNLGPRDCFHPNLQDTL